MSSLDEIRRLRVAKTKAIADLEAAIADAYEADATVSIRALGAAAGMSDETVRKLLHGRGVPVRPRGGARARK